MRYSLQSLRLSLPFVLFVSLALKATNAAAGDVTDQAQRAQLLNALRDQRAAAIQRVTSGRGSAHFERQEDVVGGNHIPQLRSTKGDQIEFSFIESKCVVLRFQNDPPNQLLSSWMIGDGQDTLFTPAGELPAQVTVRKAQELLFAVEPHEWTYARMTMIPNTFGPENEVFAAWLRRPDIIVTIEGNILRITVVGKIPKDQQTGLMSEERTYEFDLLQDGMVVGHNWRYLSNDAIELGAKPQMREVVEKRTMTWGKIEGNTLPRTDARDVTYSRDGVYDRHAASKTTFTKFQVEAIDPSAISISALRIPEGTSVWDSLSRQRWRYPDSGKKVPATTQTSSTYTPADDRAATVWFPSGRLRPERERSISSF